MNHDRRQRGRRWIGIASATGLALTALGVQPLVSTVGAVAPAPGAVFDDFEDGDTSDWGFFGGNAAGGGGGAVDDRAREGSYSMSTGWGGEGTDSGFYGGAFRNLADDAQVELPADPWINLWALAQSDTSVTAFDLELTVREDTDGNGWSDGAEDSAGYVRSFGPDDFNDQWQLVSAPLSSFFDRGTGGNGVIDGNIDEFVMVIGGVTGPAGSAVELDIDHITFTSGAPAAFDSVVFDDMEHGDPGANGWFNFNGDVGGGGIGPNDSDLPPGSTGAFSLETGWGSGGTPGFYGGFGRTSATDASGTEYFNFWINPNADQEYTLEINLQEDDNADGAATPADDDEFQFNCVVSAAGPCANSGGGWQLVSIPLADFADDNSFFTGGNGVLDPTPASRGGNGELISVVIAVIGTGGDVNFRTDDWTLTLDPAEQTTASAATVIDDFENGLANGADADGAPLGFYTFQGAGSGIGITTDATPPAPELDAVGTPNNVLTMNIDSSSFAGYIHAFENDAVDTWVPQDWSTSEGISFWFNGTNSGAGMFIDILDNRSADSTSDDAERWTVAFSDDSDDWKLYELPFSSFSRKEIGNGAPNDGLGLFAMHGYAFGALGTNGPQTFYFDQVGLYGEAEPPGLAVALSVNNTVVDEGTTGDIIVKLNRPMGPDDPEQVSIDLATEIGNAVPGEDYTPVTATATFVNGGANEVAIPIETFDNTKFSGDKRVVLRLSNPVDVERGALFQGSVIIRDDDPFDEDLRDNFELGAFLWDASGPVDFDTERTTIGTDGERPGQDVVENVLAATITEASVAGASVLAAVIADLEALLPAATAGDTNRITYALRRLDASLETGAWLDGALDESNGDAALGAVAQAIRPLQRVVSFERPEAIGAQQAIDTLVGLTAAVAADAVQSAVDAEGNQSRIDRAVRHIERAAEQLAAGQPDRAARSHRKAWKDAVAAARGSIGVPAEAATVGRDFPLGEDWTGTESLDLWFNGTGSGAEVTVTLKENRAPDPGPAGWDLVWADEFDGAAGAAPDPDNWGFEVGDVTPDGKNGWGNEELQYYTDDTDNASTDGQGNLVLTIDQADEGRECYYGDCQYESARLLSQNRAEFAYGRIESRLRVPQGSGIWPAFWSLGTDITRNPWPGAGEIDFMEFVGRLPNEIFGTVHGPGYNGGGSIGGIYDFGTPVYDDFHTFTVDWQPNLITWYVDGIQYHQVTPGDVPGPWVFEKPFFFLINLAIGGNFGGPVGDDATFPQEYAVDYVRVYQGPDSAERFETTFVDDVAGWQQVSIPVTDFTRSASQPAGAPDDGLSLAEVWGYEFGLPTTVTGTYLFDEIRSTPVPPPSALVVTNLDNSGVGSLREALALIGPDGDITFDAALAGGTLTLTSGQLTIDSSVTIDGSGVVLSGGGASRVLEVMAGADVTMSDLVIRDGAAGPRGGGVLNNGTLTLDRVIVTQNTENSGGPASFDLGGGGIFNGENSTLNLTDSTVSDNATLNQPGGGIFGFFGSTINITRSTVSGNVGADVAGGLRSLGDVNILNSTFSGNTSTAWHGGGIFHTDGVLTVTNSTFVDNIAPAGTASGILVATFGAPAEMILTNSVLQGTGGAFACAIEGGASAVITSGGGNVIADASCDPGADDQSETDPLLGPLSDNGGPTLTHAPTPTSPAIDAATATCPATDQRGVARPQGAGCDSGAVEVAPAG